MRVGDTRVSSYNQAVPYMPYASSKGQFQHGEAKYGEAKNGV